MLFYTTTRQAEAADIFEEFFKSTHSGVSRASAIREALSRVTPSLQFRMRDKFPLSMPSFSASPRMLILRRIIVSFTLTEKVFMASQFVIAQTLCQHVQYNSGRKRLQGVESSETLNQELPALRSGTPCNRISEKTSQCSEQESNLHGFPHTPLKRARLPISPSEPSSPLLTTSRHALNRQCRLE